MRESIVYQQRSFVFLVLYRWVSLAVPLWALVTANGYAFSDISAVLVLLVAVVHTALLTVFHHRLNHLVLKWPSLLAVDMLFTATLLWLSGGIFSPYYLFALSPLLASALFFQYKGALFGSGFFTISYLVAILARPFSLANTLMSQTFFMQLAGIWLLPALVAYPATLLRRLREAHRALARARDDLAQRHEELRTAHRQLTIIHDLTVSLQAAPDIETLQQRVLTALTQLGFERAVMGLINPITQRLEQWRAHPAGTPSSPISLPLSAITPSLASWLSTPEIRWWNASTPLTGHPTLDEWIGPGPWIVLPLSLREHPVGVLLVASKVPPNALPEPKLIMLRSVGEQAAVVLGTIMLCIDRAKRLAVEHERNRIAREIHDSIAQSLFGIVFTLDACIKMLPDQANEVQKELIDLRNLASRVRQQVRQSILDIWPSELTLERFKADLRKYARHVNQARMFHIEFNTGGNFDGLSPRVRRNLYRIAQEAVANAIRHAGVDSVRICLRVDETRVYMSVRDTGQGFEPEEVLCREYNREHFGVRGIRERVQALRGECEIFSHPNAGTLVLISIPVNGVLHDG